MARLLESAAIEGLRRGDRAVLARIITLLESTRAEDRVLAERVLDEALEGENQRSRPAIRVGITGPPGVGKSTLIEALGMQIIQRGMALAVLAIDPSSQRTGGSILGDKTRMPRLAVEPRAFVRPSPAGPHLGGVAARTREAVLVCEAFGFDVVIVETVGVGQSETDVATMVDTFVLLAQPGAGDELQGVKRGIMEMCDLVVVTKADGDHLAKARDAAVDLRAALRVFGPRPSGLPPQLLLASGLTGEGVPELLTEIVQHHQHFHASGRLSTWHADERRRFFRALVDERIARVFQTTHGRALAELEAQVAQGALTPTRALDILFSSTTSNPS